MVARQALERQGWSTTLCDLYAMGFDPCERADHYTERLRPGRFDVQSEQRHASAKKTIPADVAGEIERLDRADLLILQYPMWWHMPPDMLKGWLDRVPIYGEVYTSQKRFEKGRFIGKRAMLSLSVGTSPETYAFDGRSGDIDLMLWPVNFTLAYVGYAVLAPYIAYGVEAGLRYSESSVVDAPARRRAGSRVGTRRAGNPPHRPLQSHGRMGTGRADKNWRAGPFTLYAAEAAPRAGIAGNNPSARPRVALQLVHQRFRNFDTFTLGRRTQGMALIAWQAGARLGGDRGRKI
jgi:putative NADPH-quinone reductase